MRTRCGNVADRIVQHGALDITTRWPDDIPDGPDGKIYGIAAIGRALVHVPGAAIAGAAHQRSRRRRRARAAARHAPRPVGARRARGACCSSCCSAISASRVARREHLHRDPRASTTTVGLRALRRTRTSCSSRASSACSARRSGPRPTRRRREALWLGAWAGMLVEHQVRVRDLGRRRGRARRVEPASTSRRSQARRACGPRLAGAPFAVLALAYNYARWGSPFATGYGPYLGAYFGGSVFDGAWGMLASPNKSALLYSPPLVLPRSPACPRRSVRSRGSGCAILAHGRADVPRLLQLSIVERRLRVGAALLRVGRAAAARADRVVRGLGSRSARRVVLVAVVAGRRRRPAARHSRCTGITSSASRTTPRISGSASPNRSGAYIAERGRGHCDSCFEDTYELMWTPGVPADPRPLVACSNRSRAATTRSRHRPMRRGGRTRRSTSTSMRMFRARGSTGGACPRLRDFPGYAGARRDLDVDLRMRVRRSASRAGFALTRMRE